MHFLLLAILCSFINSLLIKLNEHVGVDTQIVLASNYISAILLGWSIISVNGNVSLSIQTALLSIIGGILWPVSFYMLMWGIRQYGISIAGSMTRLSLSIPILFSVIFLREDLTLLTALGILGTFIAFLLLRPTQQESSAAMDTRSIWFFPLLILTFGLVDGWANLFNTFAPQDEKYLFITMIFTMSGILVWTVILLKRIPINQRAIWRGLILGIPNFLSTYYLIESLQSSFFESQSAVVYTLFSVVGVMLAFGSGVIIWKEKVKWSNLVGVLCAVGAIILLNMRG